MRTHPSLPLPANVRSLPFLPYSSSYSYFPDIAKTTLSLTFFPSTLTLAGGGILTFDFSGAGGLKDALQAEEKLKAKKSSSASAAGVGSFKSFHQQHQQHPRESSHTRHVLTRPLLQPPQPPAPALSSAMSQSVRPKARGVGEKSRGGVTSVRTATTTTTTTTSVNVGAAPSLVGKSSSSSAMRIKSPERNSELTRLMIRLHKQTHLKTTPVQDQSQNQSQSQNNEKSVVVVAVDSNNSNVVKPSSSASPRKTAPVLIYVPSGKAKPSSSPTHTAPSDLIPESTHQSQATSSSSSSSSSSSLFHGDLSTKPPTSTASTSSSSGAPISSIIEVVRTFKGTWDKATASSQSILSNINMTTYHTLAHPFL